MKNFFSSLTWSVNNPNQVSATVNGICIALAAAIVGFAQYKTLLSTGIDISGNNIVTELGEMLALAGVIRKSWVSILIWAKPEDAVVVPTPVTNETVTIK